MKRTPRAMVVALASALGVIGIGVLAPSPAAASVPTCAGTPVEGAIRAAFPPGAQDHALAIAGRESGCRPNALNASGASGLFQMMRPMHDGLFLAVCPFLYPSVSWSIPECNSWAAALLFQGSGWAPWGG